MTDAATKKIHLADAGRGSLYCPAKASTKFAFEAGSNWTWRLQDVTCKRCKDQEQTIAEITAELSRLRGALDAYRPCSECGHTKSAHCNLKYEAWECSSCTCDGYMPDSSLEIGLRRELKEREK